MSTPWIGPIGRAPRLLLSTLLACTALIGVSATPAIAAATPCATGGAVPGDYDGDGGPDALVGFYQYVADQFRFQVIPSNGGARYGVDVNRYLANADLNGDRCSDGVFSDAGTVTLILGTPHGLDATTKKTFTVPQANPPTGDETMQTEVVVLSHDGLTQVAVAGWVVADDEADYRGQFLDVFTLDAAGNPGTPQEIDLAAHGVERNVVLAGSGRSVAIGVPDLTVAGKTGAGGVLMFSASSATPRTLAYRQRRKAIPSAGAPGSSAPLRRPTPC